MNILEEANKITSSDRNKCYGNPRENFEHISKIYNAITGQMLNPKEVAMIMIAIKLSRESYSHKRDNLVDLAGYAWVLSELEGDECYER